MLASDANVAHYHRSDAEPQLGCGITQMNESATSIAERLTQLGFSRYEARTYVGLLMSEGAPETRLESWRR